jgi:urease subunit gamma/urease subunit gamma/beta
MADGIKILTRDDVMEGSPRCWRKSSGGTFPDRTKLVTVHHPIR